MSKLRTFGIFLLLVIVCICGYWDIATFQDTLKWDMLDCYYPWKFFVGESVKHQVFPLWNPYQHLGYPIHADMRSVFYPESFIVGLLGGYSLSVLHFLFIFNISVAGLGMYRLVGLYASNGYAKVTAAIAYILCGFFVGHGQEMFGIIAATWIPWVLHYFIRFQRSLSWADLWKLSFFLFLQLTGGYQALSLMLFYLLLFLGVGTLISTYRQDGVSGVKKMAFRNAVLSAVVLASLTVLMVTYFQVAQYASRLTGLTLEEAYLNSLTWPSLVSLFTPFSVSTTDSILGTDMTMANVYSGLVMFALYIASLFRKKPTALVIIWLFGVVAFLASLGPLTPVRAFLFHYVPTMNLFRMPSFFSYFTQLSIILLGGIELGKLLDSPELNRKRFQRIALAFILIVIGIGFYHYTVFPTDGLLALQSIPKLLSVPDGFSFSQRTVSHAAIQLLFLGFLLIAVSKSRGGSNRLAVAILCIVFLEMQVSTHLNFKSTIGGGFDPELMEQQLKAQPDGFPIPALNKPLKYNIEAKQSLWPLFHNTNTYSKTVSWDGFNSFRLDLFEDYKREKAEAFEANLTEPLLFFSSNHDSNNLKITEFEPNKIVCEVYVEHASKLVYQQTYYPKWFGKVDGKPVSIGLYDEIFPSIDLPAGSHTVAFTYENIPVKVGFGISYLMLFIIIIAIVYNYASAVSNSKRGSITITVVIGALIIGAALIGYANTSSMKDLRLSDYRQLVQILNEELSAKENSLLMLQVDDEILLDSILSEEGWNNGYLPAGNLWGKGYANLHRALNKDSVEHVIVLRSNLTEDPLLIEIVHERFPSLNIYGEGHNVIYEFGKAEGRKPIFTSVNDFESNNPEWSFEFNRIDSNSHSYSGNFGWTIGARELGSPGFVSEIGKLTARKRARFVFNLKCKIPSEHQCKAHVFIQVLRDEKEVWLAGEPINTFAPSDSNWFDMTLLTIPTIDLQKEDVLRAFVWSDPSKPIYIDDTRISVYAED